MKSLKKFSQQEIVSIADKLGFRPRAEVSDDQYREDLEGYIEEQRMWDRIFGEDALENVRCIQLFPFQVKHKRRMVEGSKKATTFGLFSETGAGKTFKTLSYVVTESRPLFVVCPKSVVLDWYLICKDQPIELLGIANYETLIKCNMYTFSEHSTIDNLKRVQCPYVTSTFREVGSRKVKSFEWHDVPPRSVFAFDEAHKCKNTTSQQSKLMTTLYAYANHPNNKHLGIRIILISATIIERRENLKPFIYVLGYSDRISNSFMSNPEFSVKAFGKKLMTERRMTRLTMAEARTATGDIYTSDIRSQICELDEEKKKKVQESCQTIRDLLSSAKKGKGYLGRRVKERQNIEILKVGIFMDELVKGRQDGYSVAIFVNFKNTMSVLRELVAKEFPSNENGRQYALIEGGQKASERLRQINSFQSGKIKIILVMIGAGSVGIGLHDKIGIYKRMGLVSPPESATVLIQTFGRLDRLGSKSNSVQKVIFVKDTVEEKIAENLGRKIRIIGDLNQDEENVKDNLFMYEEVVEEEIHEEVEEIKIKIDEKKGKIVVIVPDYMVDSFEDGIPPKALMSMKMKNDMYIFDIKYKTDITTYLKQLNA